MTDLSVPVALQASSNEEHSLNGLIESLYGIPGQIAPNGLPGQVSINVHTPEESQHISSNSFASVVRIRVFGNTVSSHTSLMKRPDEELFHCMVSYRVNTDAARARAIHDGLHFKALNVNSKKKLQLFMMAKYPAGFNRPKEAKNSWLNIFLDKACLQDSKEWADEGFLSALLKSLTIIPILSWETAADGGHKGSVGGLAALNKDSPVDNVLLELVVAKELHCVLQAFAKASNQNDALYPCMHIFPIFVQDLFAKLSTLSDDAPQNTLAKAAAVLGSVGIRTDAAFMNQSVKNIMQYFTKLQGVKYYELGSDDAANEQVVTRIWDHFKKQSTAFDIDRFQFDSFSDNNPHGSELLQFLLASDASYLSRFLMKHAISSVAMLGDVRLRDDAVKNLALEVSTACKRPLLPETLKLVRVLHAAAESHLARPLQQRLDDFVDTDASILTAIYR